MKMWQKVENGCGIQSIVTGKDGSKETITDYISTYTCYDSLEFVLKRLLNALTKLREGDSNELR